MSNHRSVVVIGAGPAGLTAAYELTGEGIPPLVLEQRDKVGGLARTDVYKGYRFDIGGHRFFTKVPEVEQLWHELLGEEFLRVPRLSRIYYRGQFFRYPLDFLHTLFTLGMAESMLMALSYFKVRLWPNPEEETLEQWMTNHFGQRLFETFFKTYSEKVWGMPCDQIRADWGAQRIRGLSLTAAVSNALFGNNRVKTLINEFRYPVRGPGMMWERFAERVEAQGGEVRLNTGVTRFHRDGGHLKSLTARHNGKLTEIAADHFVSSMPLVELISSLDPAPPRDVLQAASKLKHRAFIIVGLIVDQAKLFPDNWIYVNSSEVQVGRIQNFKNWSADMVPDPHKSSVGMEYFCTVGDQTWQMSDAQLIELATRELTCLGLTPGATVEDGVVIRQPWAYPVYDFDYREHLQLIRRFLATLDNLQTIGRSGMHRYNNMDHSMLTGMLAVRNLLGESHDLWSVNTERSYHEQAMNRES